MIETLEGNNRKTARGTDAGEINVLSVVRDWWGAATCMRDTQTPIKLMVMMIASWEGSETITLQEFELVFLYWRLSEPHREYSGCWGWDGWGSMAMVVYGWRRIEVRRAEIITLQELNLCLYTGGVRGPMKCSGRPLFRTLGGWGTSSHEQRKTEWKQTCR